MGASSAVANAGLSARVGVQGGEWTCDATMRRGEGVTGREGECTVKFKLVNWCKELMGLSSGEGRCRRRSFFGGGVEGRPTMDEEEDEYGSGGAVIYKER